MFFGDKEVTIKFWNLSGSGNLKEFFFTIVRYGEIQHILLVTREIIVSKFLWIFWGEWCLANINKPFHFGAGPDHDPDPENFNDFFPFQRSSAKCQWQ